MKKILLIIVLFLSGCDTSSFSNLQEKILNPNSSTTQQASNDQCPQQPPSTPSAEEISLNSLSMDTTLKLTSDEVKAYKFQGESGKIFDHSYDKDICFWVYNHQGNLVDLKKTSSQLPQDGTYLVIMSVPQGSTTVNLKMSLKDKPKPVVNNTQPTTTSTPNNSVSKQPTSTKSPISTTSTPSHDISQSQALDIVRGWYSSKGQIFGPPYDASLVARYATDQLYYETLEKDDGGSVGWLRRNNCYYTYNFSNIENVISFNNNSADRPSLRVRVYEQLQLHGPSSSGCSNRPKSYRKNVTYWFVKDSGTWKIAKYIVE